MFGGPYRACYEGDKPLWFKDAYGSRGFGEQARALNPGEYLAGGNMFVKRSVLERAGGFSHGLGMTGSKLAYGEDTALQIQIRQEQPEQLIYYSPELNVYHLVRKDKFTLSRNAKAFFAKGQYVQWTSQEATPQLTRFVFWIRSGKALAGLAFDATWGAAFRKRARYPYVQNYYFEHTSRYLRTLGKLYAQYVRNPGAVG